MTGFFIIFMLMILGAALSVTVIAAIRNRHGKVDDSQYYDPEGNHVYYDRSSIEKKEFSKRHPEVRDVRTFKRLFNEETTGQKNNRKQDGFKS